MSSVNYKDLVLEELNYNSYLKVPELLELQQVISSPPHHDEMFFIIIHQTAELWFKELLHETHNLATAFRSGEVSHAMKALKRINAIMCLQVEQIRLLATLTPVEFAGFRDLLRPASGFQSAQYRIMEFTYGIRDPFFIKFFDKMPEVKTRLQDLLTQPSIYDECLAGLDRTHHTVPKEVLERDYSKPHQINLKLVEAVKEIYENPKDNYHWVIMFESMVDLDETFARWRKTHALMVHRTIGTKQGTGGSAGFEFLKSREDVQAFPELWEVRNLIGGSY